MVERTVRSRVVEFLGLRRSMVGMLAMAILLGMGEKMSERFLPIYLMALGASSLVPGLLNGLDNLLSALYSFPGGWLTERIGHKRALAVFNGVALLGFLIVIAIPSWWAVFLGSILFISWTSLSLPATMTLVSKVLPKNKRTMGVSLHSLIRRIPMALGPVAGGVLIDAYGVEVGVRLAFGGAFVLGVVALVFQQLLIEEEPAPAEAPSGNGVRQTLANMPASLRTLLVSDVLVRFCEQIPYAYIAIWAMQEGARVSAKEFGVLTFIEMMVALFVYIPVAWLADRSTKKPFVVITYLNFTLFPVVLYFSHTFAWLVVAFVVRGLKEFGEPTRKALILDLAPEGAKASTFGAYYLVRDLVVSVAAFASGWLWQHSPATNFLVAASFGLVGTLIFLVFGRNAPEPAR